MSEAATQSGFGSVILRAIDAFPQTGPALADWWVATRASEGLDPALFVLLGLGIAAAAWVVEIALGKASRAIMARATGTSTSPARFAVARAIAIALFFLLATAMIGVVTASEGAGRAICEAVLLTIVPARVFLLLIALLERQVDGVAADGRAVRAALLPTVVAAVFHFLRALAAIALAPSDALLAPGLLLTFGLSCATAWVFFAIRGLGEAVIRRIAGREDADVGAIAAVARNWHLLYAALIIISDAMTFSSEVGLTTHATPGAPVGLVLLMIPSLILGLESSIDRERERSGTRPGALALGALSLARGALLVVGAALVLQAWRIDPFAAEPATTAEALAGKSVLALCIIVIGSAAWRALSVALAASAPAELDPEAAMAEDGPVAKSSRYATIFPVIRGAVLTSVICVTAMMALSALGIAIGPLIAGAGVFGLAIGFGAQTIVKDIISGMFYLHEDAFRLGEYVESKEGKGVVEKISLRSVRLRHHRGAIYTIPFGAMGTIQNHSRDWVKVKFSLEVPVTEDLERIRKIIKRVGQDLLDDPAIGSSFLEPLKSQGAVAMKGANYVIGIKFASRPGEQFLIRRKAYVALQRAFAENGVETAKNKVVVEATAPHDIVGAAASGALPAS